MRFPFNVAALVLVAASLTGVPVGQIDPCDPGGAKFGTKDCPEKKKSLGKQATTEKSNNASKGSSASNASASTSSASDSAPAKKAAKAKSAAKKKPPKQDSAAPDK
jgi:hypothetical protein